jgi:hypothetical protein
MAKLVGEDEALAVRHHGCPRYWRNRVVRQRLVNSGVGVADAHTR